MISIKWRIFLAKQFQTNLFDPPNVHFATLVQPPNHRKLQKKTKTKELRDLEQPP